MTMATGGFCTNCGAKLNPGAQFCVSCGQSVEGGDQLTAVADTTIVRKPAQASVGPTASVDAPTSFDAVDYASPAQAASLTPARATVERAERGRAGRVGRGPAIAATVAIVFSGFSVLLCLLYIFVLPAGAGRIAPAGRQQEQASKADSANNPSENSDSQKSRPPHTDSPGRPSQEQSPSADLTSDPSGSSGGPAPGSVTDQSASSSGAPKNSPTEGERDPGYRTGFHEPFWGVWTFASKSASEAVERATSMTAEGFDSTIELTTDWSNLNDEKWYVVTTGMWRSREEAESMVSSLRAAGYLDAYAKYSGEYVGGEK